jgi:hypothetical protein
VKSLETVVLESMTENEKLHLEMMMNNIRNFNSSKIAIYDSLDRDPTKRYLFIYKDKGDLRGWQNLTRTTKGFTYTPLRRGSPHNFTSGTLDVRLRLDPAYESDPTFSHYVKMGKTEINAKLYICSGNKTFGSEDLLNFEQLIKSGSLPPENIRFL